LLLVVVAGVGLLVAVVVLAGIVLVLVWQ